MAGKRMDKERTALRRHRRMRKLRVRLQDRLDELSSDDRELDVLAAMTELSSRRMQQLMERRSKLLATVSNLLKRMADTQEEIIANLK
jgi:hypothetical protein